MAKRFAWSVFTSEDEETLFSFQNALATEHAEITAPYSKATLEHWKKILGFPEDDAQRLKFIQKMSTSSTKHGSALHCLKLTRHSGDQATVVGFIEFQVTTTKDRLAGNIREIYIRSIVVEPSMRRKGHGRRLYDAMIEYLGIGSRDVLRLQVLDMNKAAAALYFNLGFKITQWEFLDLGDDSGFRVLFLCMQKLQGEHFASVSLQDMPHLFQDEIIGAQCHIIHTDGIEEWSQRAVIEAYEAFTQQYTVTSLADDSDARKIQATIMGVCVNTLFAHGLLQFEVPPTIQLRNGVSQRRRAPSTPDRSSPSKVANRFEEPEDADFFENDLGSPVRMKPSYRFWETDFGSPVQLKPGPDVPASPLMMSPIRPASERDILSPAPKDKEVVTPAPKNNKADGQAHSAMKENGTGKKTKQVTKKEAEKEKEPEEVVEKTDLDIEIEEARKKVRHDMMYTIRRKRHGKFGKPFTVGPKTYISFRQDNPKLEGSNCYKQYDSYKHATTILEFSLANAGRPKWKSKQDLEFDVQHGLCVCPAVRPCGPEKADSPQRKPAMLAIEDGNPASPDKKSKSPLSKGKKGKKDAEAASPSSSSGSNGKSTRSTQPVRSIRKWGLAQLKVAVEEDMSQTLPGPPKKRRKQDKKAVLVRADGISVAGA